MSFPWPHSFIVFLIALWPAQIIAVALHEAGHVLAGRFVGVSVRAWGVGIHKVRFRIRLGRSIFYLAQPTNFGLTIYNGEPFELTRRQNIVFLAGGPIATFVGLAVGLMAWQYGIRSDLLVAWIVISFVFSCASILPYTYRVGAVTLQSDARRLMDLAVYGCPTRTMHSGATLSSTRRIAELLSELGDPCGASYFRIAAAFLETSLGDFDAARESIAIAESTSGVDLETIRPLAAIAQAVLAVETIPADADEPLCLAQSECAHDAMAQFLIELMQLEVRRVQGGDIREALQELRSRTDADSRPDWTCLCDAVLFEIDPPSDIERGYRELVKTHKSMLPDVTNVRLLTHVVERLTENADHVKARKLFSEAQKMIEATAGSIASETTRNRFVERAAAPLQRAVVTTTDQVPLFIDITSAHAEPKSAESKSRAPAFAYLTLIAGIGSLVAVATALALRDVGGNRSPGNVGGWTIVVSLLLFVSLCTSLISILRSERRLRTVLVGLALVALSIGIAVVLDLPQPNHRPGRPIKANIGSTTLRDKKLVEQTL